MADLPFLVRFATIQDVDAIVRLNEFVQSLHARHRPDVFHAPGVMRYVTEYFQGLLTAPDHALFVAEMDARVVGYLLAEVQDRPPNEFAHGYDRAYVHQLSVDPANRRRGIGRALMTHLDAWAREQQLESIALDTWSFNTGAKGFFEALGFETYNVRLSRSL